MIESPKSTVQKKIKKPKCRTNVHVSNSQRVQLLDLIHNQKHTITKAAQIANIKYENAKLINKIYIQQGRLNKINDKKNAKINKLLNPNDARQNQLKLAEIGFINSQVTQSVSQGETPHLPQLQWTLARQESTSEVQLILQQCEPSTKKDKRSLPYPQQQVCSSHFYETIGILREEKLPKGKDEYSHSINFDFSKYSVLK